MDKYQAIFRRTEKKYALSEAQLEILKGRIAPYTLADNFGKYSICNIYFDTERYDIINLSLQKPDYKEKLRLRSYGVPEEDSTVFLEIKKKFDGVVYKRRAALPLEDAENWISTGKVPLDVNQNVKELDYFIKSHKLTKRLFLAYDRMAFNDIETGSVRITFDSNVRYRTEEPYLQSGDHGQPLLQDGIYLMEIKTQDAIPLWMVKILDDMKLYPVSFSKYGNVYKKFLHLGVYFWEEDND